MRNHSYFKKNSTNFSKTKKVSHRELWECKFTFFFHCKWYFFTFNNYKFNGILQ